MTPPLVKFSLANLKRCPSFYCATEMQAICSSLFKSSPINYFSYTRIYPDGSFLDLNTNPDWTKHYLQNGYYQAGVEQAVVDFSQKNTFIWNRTSGFFDYHHKLEQFYLDCRDFNLTNGLSIHQSYSHYFELFHFTTGNPSGNTDNFFLSHYDTLLKFVFYFKEKMIASKQLTRASAYRYLFTGENDNKSAKNVITTSNREPIDFSPNVSKFYINNQLYLTKREMAILQYIMQSYTCKEIAQLFNLSHRTVETHLNNIKAKTACHNTRDLHRFINNNHLLSQLLHNNLL